MTTQAPKEFLYFLTCITIFLIGAYAYTEESPGATLPESPEIVNRKLYGQVINEEGVPASEAKIVHHSELEPLRVMANQEGHFLNPEVSKNLSATLVRVNSPGMFEVFRTFSLLPNQQTYAETKTLDCEIIGSMLSSTGGTLNQTNRPRTDFSDTSCLLYTSPSPRDQRGSRMPSSA